MKQAEAHTELLRTDDAIFPLRIISAIFTPSTKLPPLEFRRMVTTTRLASLAFCIADFSVSASPGTISPARSMRVLPSLEFTAEIVAAGAIPFDENTNIVARKEMRTNDRTTLIAKTEWSEAKAKERKIRILGPAETGIIAQLVRAGKPVGRNSEAYCAGW